MKRLILLVAVLLFVVAVVSPIAVSGEDVVGNDTTIAKLDMHRFVIQADPECPPPGGGTGGC